MTYDEWIAAVSNLLVIDPTDADFLAYAPRAIEYAEQRMYRELDLLYTFESTTPATCTPNTSSLTLPADTIVVNGINIITPASTAPDSGTRNPLQATTRDFIDAVYGSVTSKALPQFYAMQDNLTVRLGPWPDAAYQAEIKRTFRPAPLSSSNTTTILTTFVPAAFLAGTMVAWSLYQRDMPTSGSDEPGRAANWESAYAAEMASAVVEAFRQKGLSASATAFSTSPALNTQRG